MKFKHTLILLFPLILASCRNPRIEFANQTSLYDIYETINFNVETGKLNIKTDSRIEENKFEVYYKYASTVTSNGQEYTFTSNRGMYNEINVTFNPNQNIKNLNIKSAKTNLVLSNLTIENLDLSINYLVLNQTNTKVINESLNYQYSQYIKLNKNLISTLNSTSDRNDNFTIQENEFNKININSIKSKIHFYQNKFDEAYIKQDQGKIDGAFVTYYGYTVDCTAKQLDTAHMNLVNNIYGDGSSLIKFEVTNGVCELWVG